MIQCLQSYLKLGLVEQTAKNLKMRKFIAESSMEFYEWISSDNENFEMNARHDKSSKFDSFTNEYQDYKKSLSRKRFQQWVEKYGYQVSPYVIIKAGGIDANIEFVKVK